MGGSGLVCYVKDPNTALTSQGAIYDTTTAQIEPIPAWGAFAAYQHRWTNSFRSVVVCCVVDVDNLDIEGPDGMDRMQYFLVNLSHRPFRRMDIGIEYLWAEWRNKDGDKGKANRVHFGLNYGF